MKYTFGVAWSHNTSLFHP